MKGTRESRGARSEKGKSMDISLYYEERGAGFPLVLLHGNGESHKYFARQMEPFSRAFRVLAPDTRGHGRSPRGEGAFTLRRFADDLYDFLRARGIERAHILGFSDGGNIALYFALAHPEMVDHLILNGANLRPAGVKRRYQLPIEIGYKIAKRFAGKSAGARAHAETLALMVNEPDISPERLHALTMPTLVVAGTKDMIRRSHTEEIAKNLPNATAVFLPGNHFVAAGNPEAFNAATLEFLRK